MNNTMDIRLDTTEDKITLEIDASRLWWELDEITQEYILEESGVWSLIQRSLKYKLGKTLSTPSFYPSVHKLREMICTDPEFVNEITITFIKQILEEWGKAEQSQRSAERAFWKLYHKVDRPLGKTDFPSEIRREEEGEHLRMDSKTVRNDIMKHFRELLRKSNDAQ